MDSLSQIALGSAVGVAVMGRRTALWKAALAGAVFGTLPDLDVVIDHGDPIRNMTFHRAESHALFYLTLLSPLFAWLTAKLLGELQQLKRWWLAIWLILITHALLDFLTVYGTQLALPFTATPFGLGSIFIIDPLYTLPLLIGLISALILGRPGGLRWNTLGLGLSTLYLLWGMGAQQYVEHVAENVLAAEQQEAEQVLVTATAFNTLLWRVLVITEDDYLEGFYSLLDKDALIHFRRYPRGIELLDAVQGNWEAERIRWFTRGFYKLSEVDDQLIISDLRMGQEPHYSFNFVLAERVNDQWAFVTPTQKNESPDLNLALNWLWQRMWGEPVSPPWL